MPRNSATSGRKKEAITRAQGAINNPSFYRQIGRDPDEAIKAGGAAMRERFEAMRNKRIFQHDKTN